jgi:hypothetical protein
MRKEVIIAHFCLHWVQRTMLNISLGSQSPGQHSNLANFKFTVVSTMMHHTYCLHKHGSGYLPVEINETNEVRD